MNADLVTYYKQRVAEYEKIYAKPERQDDLEAAAGILQHIFSGKQVFEINCGTGYWTEQIARTAAGIFATDINQTSIDLAVQKDYANTPIRFGIADIFNYIPSHRYESLFSGFIWSHIPLQHVPLFLQKVNQFVQPGGTVVLMDNNYVEGSSTPIAETDSEGNTFQLRKLADGSEHLVRKNFPDEDFVLKCLIEYTIDPQFIKLDYFWIITFTTKTNKPQP